MAVANGTIAEFLSWTTPTPVTLEFTPAVTARGIVVTATINGSVTDQFTGITVEGVAMARVDFAIDNISETGRVEIWWLAGTWPGGVAQTIQISTTGAGNTKWASVASVTSLSTPQIGLTSKLEGDQANPQITLNTGTVSSLRMVAVFSGHDAQATLVELATMQAAVTASHHDFGTTVTKLGRQAVTETGAVTVGWTAATEDMAMVAIAIQEAGGGVLPTVAVGQAGHVDHHNLIHGVLNGHDALVDLAVPTNQYPSTSDGPLAEFYNMMMAHFDGTRATPFFVNVQHPEFGATGIDSNALNEAPALNAATMFASLSGAGVKRSVWIPATNSAGGRARYYVDTPFRVYTGLTVWAHGARIAASPRFDFVTKFPNNNDSWTDIEQGIVEGCNVTPENPLGRTMQGRYNLRGGLIEGMSIPGSIGALFNMQQQSTWHQVRIEGTTRIGLLLVGQQGIFHDLMITGPGTTLGPSSTYPMIGLQLGLPDDVAANYTASFMWFYGTNFETSYRGIYQHRSAGANVFRDTHFEGIKSTNPADPGYPVYLSRGQIVIDQAWWTVHEEYGTFLKVDGTVGADASYNLSDIFVNCDGFPGDNALFLDDAIRGHLIQGWGDTKLAGANEEGIVRHVNSFIGTRMADGLDPRKHVISIAHDEGGYTAFGTYNRDTADANQQPLLRMRPGATQMGHLLSWYDKAGVERFIITADGVPKLPGYTAATKPSAVGREAVMIYDLDTNKVQVSDGSTWIDLH